MLTEKLFITDGELYNTMLNEKVNDHKIRLGGPYYYGKEQEKFFCFEAGEKLSWFIDKKGNKYKFYNEDIYKKAYKEKIEVKWCPKYNERYYYITSDGNSYIVNNTNEDFDKWHIQTGNCFPYTKEGKKQCEEYKQKLISLGDTK